MIIAELNKHNELIERREESEKNLNVLREPTENNDNVI